MSTNGPPLKMIMDELNARSTSFSFGDLQAVRKSTLGLSRTGSTKPFHATDRHWANYPDWIHHSGGRTELQFNIGFEEDARRLRHGVAFSFETSRAIHDPVDLIGPAVAHFNDWIRAEREHLANDGFLMWCWVGENASRTKLVAPHEIPQEWVAARPKHFIFLGKLGPSDPEQVDYDAILEDFDRLMPLYEYVLKETHTEGTRSIQTKEDKEIGEGKHSTQAFHPARLLNIVLRHRKMQEKLVAQLKEEAKDGIIRFEDQTVLGTRPDVEVIHANGDRTIYEIKTAGSARLCIREALGQLLEYALWPGMAPANELVVVGDAPPTVDSEAYLQTVRDQYKIQVSYRLVEA